MPRNVPEDTARRERRKHLTTLGYSEWCLTRGEARPVELPRELGDLPDVLEHRNVDCPRYDECLGVVATTSWASFSCAKCPNFTLRADVPEAADLPGPGW